jgi:hypothetical protein
MTKKSFKYSERDIAYQIDRGFRGAKAGAAVGLVLGALASMLFSRWISENYFGPIVFVTAAIFAVVFGLFFPLELSYRELDDGPDSIKPADRVDRIHSDT